MKRYLMGALVLASFCLSGCVYDAGYERYSNFNGTGYQESSYGNGKWGVAFVGRYPDFCKEAAFYRAAELTWEKDHRYFEVLLKEDRSTNVHTGAHTTAMGGQIAGSSVYVPVYYYKIHFLERKPSGGKFVDAYHVLDTHNLPRKDQPYTVAERNKEKAAGNK